MQKNMTVYGTAVSTPCVDPLYIDIKQNPQWAVWCTQRPRAAVWYPVCPVGVILCVRVSSGNRYLGR